MTPLHYISINDLNEPDWKEAPKEIYDSFYPVTVWRASVSSLIPFLDDLQGLLQPQEMEKAMRYQQETDRRQRILSKAVLRILLNRFTGIDPKEFWFRSDENKKPIVENAIFKDIHFNVSHSGDWILIAISDTKLGIDMEQTDASFTYQNILPLSFSPQEISFIENSIPSYQSFYQLWTRKESFLKATGKGLVDDLSLIPSLNGVHQHPIAITGSAESWQVSSFKVDENHVGSVTFSPVKTALQFFNFRL